MFILFCMFFFSDDERKLIRDYRDGTVTEREIIEKKYGYKILARLVDEKEAMEKKFNDEEFLSKKWMRKKCILDIQRERMGAGVRMQ